MVSSKGPPVFSRPQYHSDLGVITTVGLNAVETMVGAVTGYAASGGSLSGALSGLAKGV